ncbi:MAG: DUF839 domain-containing protein [Candidatus Hydrogenedentes bacterium]|nr:DUF839 domain-containing protein [Candidatus Hydrogenedentota bacterium]
MPITRRRFLATAAAVTAGFSGLRAFVYGAVESAPDPAMLAAGFGPLIPDSAGLFDLPKGFVYTIVSRAGDKMDDGFVVPSEADGMAAFAGPDGKTIVVRNHELSPDKPEWGPYGAANELFEKIDRAMLYDAGRGKAPCLGGTTTFVYDTKTQKLGRQYLSLAGTGRNCAGGPTPWNTWITCEETVQRADDSFEKDHGYNFEVPASASIRLAEPHPIVEMGRFNHEAIAVDPKSGIVYETEDREDGLIYRYTPNTPGDLHKGGKLQALVVCDKASLDTRNWGYGSAMVPLGEKLGVKWIDMEDVQSPNDDLRARGFDSGAARFARGEGMWYGRDAVYFACTNGGKAQRGQIWRYTPSPVEGTAGEEKQRGTLELFVEPNNSALVDNADNLTVAPWGDLIVAEDGKNEQYLVGVTPEGKLYHLGKNAKSSSELAGVTFSPDGSTLFFNIQHEGLTLAITGPWHGPA